MSGTPSSGADGIHKSSHLGRGRDNLRVASSTGRPPSRAATMNSLLQIADLSLTPINAPKIVALSRDQRKFPYTAGLCQSNGRSSARGATRPPSSDIQVAPL